MKKKINLGEKIKARDIMKVVNLQNAIEVHKWACLDVKKGVNYFINRKLYNKCMKAAGSKKRAKTAVRLNKFVKRFYKAYNKLYTIMGHKSICTT